ncbi:MAG TPA: efflux RND transporter periplasmic adaptor subunit [Pseudomonadales bacterium]|nr:efflux RND transporter periplasmic adaptor subunit [Pseudomonadales bacterium]
MKFSMKRVIRPLLILMAGVAIAVVMVSNRQIPPSEPGPNRLPYVDLQTIALGDQEIVVRAHGTLVSSQILRLASEVAGPVVWVSPSFNEGAYVEAGDVLFKIESIPYELALAQAKASLATAKVALADAEALQRKARVVEAKANIEVAEQLVRKATLDLSKTTVKAPFNAILDTAPVELGEYLSPGKLVATLLGTDMGEIHLPLLQSDAVYLSQHDKVKVSIKREIAGEIRTWPGRFARLEGRLNEQTRVLNAVVEVPEPYGALEGNIPLVLGAFVEVEMQAETVRLAAAIPQLAIHAGSTVYVFDDGMIRKRTVEQVHADGRGSVVIRGLEDGDQVVINRLETMYESMPVAVKHE